MASAVIGALRVNLGLDSATFQNGLTKAQIGLQKFGKALKIGMIAAAGAATVAVGALAVGVQKTIDAADDMSKAAQKIGIPIEELSRLKYAADLSGVSFEALQTGVGRLSRVMNDAKNGTKEAVDSFKQIGVEVTNADGTMKSASQVMAEISDRFAAMPDGAEKTALAMELMGRAGANMIPLLNGGSESLNQLMAEADSFGQVFTQEMGSSAEAFNDNITRLEGTFAAITAEVAQRLLPYLAQFSDWLVANAPKIADIVVKVVEFSAAVVQLGVDVVRFVTDSWAQFEAAWQRVGEIRDRAVAAFVDLRDQALAAVSEMVTKIRDWLTSKLNAAWDSVAGKIESVTGAFRSMYDAVVGNSYVPDMVEEIGRWMERLEDRMVRPAMDAADRTAGAFKGVRDSFDSMFSSFGSSIADAIRGTKEWSDVLADVLGMLAQNVLQGAFGGGGFGGGGGLLSGLLGNLFGFAGGGRFRVGGTGGIDSQLVAFRASPNETVSVSKPGQGFDNQLTIRLVDGDGNELEARETQTAGGLELSIMIDQIVGDAVARRGSKTHQSLAATFGVSNQLNRR